MTVLYIHQAGDGYVENSCPRNPQPLKILAHAWPLSPTTPEYEGPGVEVLVSGSRRSRPEAKHSSWLRDREHLDTLKVKVRYFSRKLSCHPLSFRQYSAVNLGWCGMIRAIRKPRMHIEHPESLGIYRLYSDLSRERSFSCDVFAYKSVHFHSKFGHVRRIGEQGAILTEKVR